MGDEKFMMMCFREMFKRVGEKFPNEELTKHKDWYSRRTWTEKEQDSFKKWLKKKIASRWRYLKGRKLEFEVEMFILMWGWRTEEKENG